MARTALALFDVQRPVCPADVLRPIVTGRRARRMGDPQTGAGCIAFAVAPAGRLLGFAVVDRSTSKAAWGSLSTLEAGSLADTLARAETTALTLSLLRIDRASHHLLVRSQGGEPPTIEFLESLQPLFDAGLCEIVSADGGGGSIEPPLSHDAAVAGAREASLAALRLCGVSPDAAGVACLGRSSVAKSVVAALGERGLHPVCDAGPAHVLIVDGEWWPQIPVRRLYRASVIVSVASRCTPREVDEQLARRGIFHLPAPLSAAGPLLAARFVEEGVVPVHEIAERAAAVLGRLTTTLVERAQAEAVPVGWALEAHADGR
jgi:hypothetical protein